jgi:hypothetical protein
MMTDMNIPLPEQQRVVRGMLTEMMEMACDGKFLSAVLVAETASGQMFLRRTELVDPLKVAGFMDQAKNDLATEAYYDLEQSDLGEDMIEFDLVEDDEDEDDDEDVRA